MRALLWVFGVVLLMGCQGNGLSPSSGMKGFRSQQSSDVGKPFVQMGHLFQINSIKIGPNEKYIVSSSDDNMIKLWDIKNEKEIKSINRNYTWNSSLAFSPNGEYIIFGDGKSVKRWDIKSGKEKKVFDILNTSGGNVVVFSPNGKYIATDYNSTIRLWNLEENKEVKAFKSKGLIQSIDFSPDGKYIVSGDWDGTIKLWNIESGKEVKIFRGHLSYVKSLKFSPNGKYILSGSNDKTVKLWNIETEKVRTFKGYLYPVEFVDFSNNGKEIITSTLFKTKIIDIQSKQEIKIFKGLAYDVSLNYIVLAKGKSIKLYNTDIKKEIKFFKWYSSSVKTLLNPTQKYIISANTNTNTKIGIYVRDRKNGRILKTFDGNGIVALSPDMKYIAFDTYEKKIKIQK
ncbi:MAG: High-affnity carbon uptake protein Hat/HatR [uncultured Sulfurovum sp.]|uniref:High-affnity carbon uptake protein Hat/HatR n=1 Tax=uncultured Sulfurovum sp. TaxID=269237 RepID=A0A6S6TWN7_9BACT|nr:MAG: High-affnity carbon uptake protein Hat/HatR [uncultured Sulfurovum sp.]